MCTMYGIYSISTPSVHPPVFHYRGCGVSYLEVFRLTVHTIIDSVVGGGSLVSLALLYEVRGNKNVH